MTIDDSRDNGNTNVLQILAVPRGCRIEKDGTGAMTIDGEAAELRPVEPFKGTPALTDQRDCKRVEPEPFETVELEVPENVTRMDTFKNRRADDDGGPDAA